jgi:hypothetical protein
VLNLDGVIERLSELLPPTFEDLDRYFAVSWGTCGGFIMQQHQVLKAGHTLFKPSLAT